MREIQLTKGYVAYVDDEDFDRVNAFSWQIHENMRKDGTVRNAYAARSAGAVRTKQKLHRFILGITDPEIEVDHRDHDGLNNQRGNLRVATGSQNQHNRRKRFGTSSQFKGVSWLKGTVYNGKQYAGKWQARIQIRFDSKSQSQYLGYFTDEVEAALAYDAAARQHFGEFALTNFPLEGLGVAA
jgi:hypothetical protein